MSEEFGQELGRLSAEVEGLRRDENKLADGLLRIEARLGEIEKTLSEARGGWRTMIWFGGAMATLGSGVTGLLMWWLGKPH